MALPSVTFTFTNGTTADATQINTNYTDLVNSMTDATKSFSIDALTCAGVVTFNGAVNLGNATSDDLTISASLASSIPIKTAFAFDIGAATLGLRDLYFGSDDAAANTVKVRAGTVAADKVFTLPEITMTMPIADGAAKDYMQTDGAGAMSFVGGPALTAKTTTYIVTTADKLITADTSGGAWSLTLYAASGNAGRVLEVIKTTSDTNVLTIDGDGTETINGALTIKLNTQYESAKIMCDGSNWFIVDRTIPSIWTAYTPTTQGFGTISGVDMYKRRVGSSLQVVGDFTTGTVAASEGQIGLGETISSIIVGTIQVGLMGYDASASLQFYLLATGGDTFVNFSLNSFAGATNNLLAIDGSAGPGSSKRLAFNFTVPIADWEG